VKYSLACKGWVQSKKTLNCSGPSFVRNGEGEIRKVCGGIDTDKKSKKVAKTGGCDASGNPGKENMKGEKGRRGKNLFKKMKKRKSAERPTFFASTINHAGAEVLRLEGRKRTNRFPESSLY